MFSPDSNEPPNSDGAAFPFASRGKHKKNRKVFKNDCRSCDLIWCTAKDNALVCLAYTNTKVADISKRGDDFLALYFVKFLPFLANFCHFGDFL